MNITISLREAMLLRWACRQAIAASAIIKEQQAVEAMICKLNMLMWLWLLTKGVE